MRSWLGRALTGIRDKVFLATKFGHVVGPYGRSGGVNGRPGYLVEACETSRRRLQVDVIDLAITCGRWTDSRFSPWGAGGWSLVPGLETRK